MSLFFSLFPCKSFHTFSLLYLTSFLLNQKKSMYVLTCLTLISVHVISLIFSICVPHVFHIFCWSFTSCPSCLYIYIYVLLDFPHIFSILFPCFSKSFLNISMVFPKFFVFPHVCHKVLPHPVLFVVLLWLGYPIPFNCSSIFHLHKAKQFKSISNWGTSKPTYRS